MMKQIYITLILLFYLMTASAVELPGIPEFVDEMVGQHQFDRVELEQLFSSIQHRPDVIEAISKPATKKPWFEYRAAFINRQRINQGLDFWRRHEKSLQRAESKYGVPTEIIVAIIGVETMYGRHAGRFRTLDALTTLAFDYPRRSVFFRDELKNYLLLAREQDFKFLDIKASYAGAMGIPQFMPSSYRRYAVDFNANGRADLLAEPEDAIGSVANYLKEYGWKMGEPIAEKVSLKTELTPDAFIGRRGVSEWSALGVTSASPTVVKPLSGLLDFTMQTEKEYWLVYENFRVITLYNNSNYYAMSVFQLAQALREAFAQ